MSIRTLLIFTALCPTATISRLGRIYRSFSLSAMVDLYWVLKVSQSVYFNCRSLPMVNMNLLSLMKVVITFDKAIHRCS